jgi:hypothetical protein
MTATATVAAEAMMTMAAVGGESDGGKKITINKQLKAAAEEAAPTAAAEAADNDVVGEHEHVHVVLKIGPILYFH